MRPLIRRWAQRLLGLSLLALFGYVIFVLVRFVWRELASLDSEVSVAVITGAATVLGATLTIVLGRYFERRRETEAHFREKKVEIYDEFLREFFKLFYFREQTDLVSFIREWQRKVLLWGGDHVLATYIAWMRKLSRGNPDAQTMFMTEDFFRAIRSDLGLSNRRLTKGLFVHLMLQNSDLFLRAARENPNVTLAELAELERQLGLEAAASSVGEGSSVF